ncbi:unnamed protein product [Leptosia nina]|uniref:peptidylprolyl isomerase n=1 Tax=Leptosia nina TaxID=320188 RepID=A0AAV1JVA6_9NEOP
MDEQDHQPVELSEGITISKILNSPTVFKIDVDHKKAKDINLDDDFDDVFNSDSSSETDDIISVLEESTSKMMLSCPEYHNFADLATKMVDCVSSGDVKILILEEGDGPLVPIDAEVSVHYAAYWEKAKIPFDSTLTMNNGAPSCIKLGKGRLIPGLEIGLTSVRSPKARFLLLIQPKLAWGPRGVPPRIRPDPAMFVINLYSVNDTQAPIRFNDLPSEEQRKYEVTIRTVTSLHAQAKDFFSKRKYNRCIKNYQQSISVLNLSVVKNGEEESEVRRFKINTFVNLAVCYYKTNRPKYVIKMCKSLDFLTDIEKHCKALFYYGRAYELLGNMESALIYYKKALKLEPQNRDVGKALSNLDTYNKVSVANEKTICQNMFESVPERKVVHDVDLEFQHTIRDMCENLAGKEEYSKFELPNGFKKKEIDYIKDLCSEFQDLVVQEDGKLIFTGFITLLLDNIIRVLGVNMLRFLILSAFLQCTISQQYQQKVAPGVPPQNYQNYQPPPPPPAPVHQQQYQQQPPPQQQFQQPPQQQFQQQVPVQQVNVQPPHGHGHDPQVLNAANIAQERDHIQEHMDVPIDTSKMSDQELQFHYFKMHDADNNNKLDGCELIKSLIHWHGQVDKSHRVYSDQQLEKLLETALNHTDLNNDGYIDYLEYRISNLKAEVATAKRQAAKVQNKA